MKQFDIRSRLLNISSVTEFDVKDVLYSNSALHFNEIVNSMREIFKVKDHNYGNFLDNADPDEKVALFEHYIMIKRKYSRLATYSKARVKGEELPLDGVLDTYLDLAIYSAMGVLLVLTLMEKDDEKSRECSTQPSIGSVDGRQSSPHYPFQ